MQPVTPHTPLAFAPPQDRPTLTGRQTAARVDLSWERFRKVRETWTRDRDFPAELNEPGEPVRYDAAAVERWVQRRSARVHAAAPAPAPQARTPVEGLVLAREGRAGLRKLKGGF
jgi:hypothetical protein